METLSATLAAAALDRPRSGWDFDAGEEIARGRHAVRLLGGGRRYEAYLAWDDDLHALVVAKLLRPGLVQHPESLAVLRAEAAALAELQHPLLVRGFGGVLGGDRPHLVLEFVEGPRLSTLIRRYGLVIEQLLPLALSVCSALHFIARRGWVHLDVKPRNVIMGAAPRLIDLSVAHPVERARSVKMPVGTRLYMAPEQCDPDRFGEIGPPADVWGLAVTLHEALTRELPFHDDGTEHPQLNQGPRTHPRVPPALAQPLSACLDWQPGNRPTASELAFELEPLVDALPAPKIGRFRPGRRRR